MQIDLFLLFVSISVLFVSPLIFYWAKPLRTVEEFLNGFVVASLSLLLALHIVPDAISDAGGFAIGAFVLGISTPLLFERIQGHFSKTHHFAILLGGLALSLHALIDGVAIGAGAADQSLMILAAGVVLHRLPVGLALWWLVQPTFGNRIGWAVLVTIAVATGAGYWFGGEWYQIASPQMLGIFQGFVSGMLLHVIFHNLDHDHSLESSHEEHEKHEKHEEKQPEIACATKKCCSCNNDSLNEEVSNEINWRELFDLKWAQLFGVIVGIFVVVMLPIWLESDGHEHGHAHAHDAVVESTTFATRFLTMALESAPALVLGVFFAGLISVALPEGSLRWMRHSKPLVQAWRGMLFGLPLPICSCGVVPMYQSLIQQGVPAAAAMAFLIATPELGIEALIISIPFLGPELTAVRLIAAAVLAISVGWGVGRLIPVSKKKIIISKNKPKIPIRARVYKAFHYAIVDVAGDTFAWLLAGLALAAAFDPGKISAIFASIPSSVELLAFALLGLPIYVCASGATPLAAAFLVAGVSPGAVLAFLLSGPATNITTYGVLSKLHSPRIALAFGAGVWFMAVFAGFVTNYLFSFVPRTGGLVGDHEHFGPISWISLVLLSIILLYTIARQGPRSFIGTVIQLGAK